MTLRRSEIVCIGARTWANSLDLPVVLSWTSTQLSHQNSTNIYIPVLALKKSDSFPAEYRSNTGSQDDDAEVAGQQNLDLLVNTATRTSSLASTGRHSRREKSSESPESGSDTVLGHWQCDSEEEQSHQDKVHIAKFTRGICSELGVPTTEALQIIHIGLGMVLWQLTTHQLLIVFLCKSLCDKQVTHNAALNTYIKSPDFNVSWPAAELIY